MLLIIGLGTVACVYAQVNGPYPVPPQANGAYPVPYPVPIHANGPRPVPYPVPPKANGAYPVPYPVPPMTNNPPTVSMDLDNPSDGIGADYSDDEGQEDYGGDYIATNWGRCGVQICPHRSFKWGCRKCRWLHGGPAFVGRR